MRRSKIAPFLRWYRSEYSRFAKASSLAEDLVNKIFLENNFGVHQIVGRTKAIDSVRNKIYDKKYKDPNTQITDIIGVRIITHYMHDADRAIEIIKKEFTIDNKNSVDKRSILGPGEFGYRSVHLITKLNRSRGRMPEYAVLKNLWFEVQIRSLLEHAWATINHEIVYKSKIKYPNTTLRRFAAIAGALEILDREFQEMPREREKLIDEYKEAFDRREGLNKKLDTARLLGLLELYRPNGLSWRKAEMTNKPFPTQIEVSCVYALNDIGVNTPKDLSEEIGKASTKRAIRKYASANGIAPDEVSHLALVVLLVGLKDISILENFFGDIGSDQTIIEAIGG
jgi:ppGpp synthetase/RelA/SpoT-type nucleotidyltranferase